MLASDPDSVLCFCLLVTSWFYPASSTSLPMKWWVFTRLLFLILSKTAVLVLLDSSIPLCFPWLPGYFWPVRSVAGCSLTPCVYIPVWSLARPPRSTDGAVNPGVLDKISFSFSVLKDFIAVDIFNPTSFSWWRPLLNEMPDLSAMLSYLCSPALLLLLWQLWIIRHSSGTALEECTQVAKF